MLGGETEPAPILSPGRASSARPGSVCLSCRAVQTGSAATHALPPTRPGVAFVGPQPPARSLHPARPADLPPGKQMHQRVPLAHSLFCMSSGSRGGTRTQQAATASGEGQEEGRRGVSGAALADGHPQTHPAEFLLQRAPPDCAARVVRSRRSLHKQKLLLG